MPDSHPKVFAHVEELLNEAKIEEALEIIEKFEKTEEITPKDRLSILISKGKISLLQEQFKNVTEFGNLAYKLSQQLGLDYYIIEALVLKASQGLYAIKLKKYFDYILEAERRLNSLTDKPIRKFSELRLGFLFIKAIMSRLNGDLEVSFKIAFEGLKLAKKNRRRLYIGRFLNVINRNYSEKLEYDTALDYAIECLEIFNQLGYKIGIANILSRIAMIYYMKGDLNQALTFINESMTIKKITYNNFLLGNIFKDRGELNKALEYYKQFLEYGRENDAPLAVAISQSNIGRTFRLMGDLNQAEKYLKQSLIMLGNSDSRSWRAWRVYPTLYLLLTHLEKSSFKDAQLNLNQLKELVEEYDTKIVKQGYNIGKAYILKSSNRMREKVEAVELLKQNIEDKLGYLQFNILSIVLLCDLLLEELSLYNNLEIFEEINPLIIQLLKIAEENNSFSFLSEAYLLRARVALIKLNLDNARQYLTKAQQIADEHDLTLLARKISHEHDKLVEELDTWQNFKKTQVSMSKRIKLASIDGVMDRMQEKRAIDPPELIDEQATLLLIIAEGGVLVFSYPFTDEWKQDETLFSSFLSAFTSFSDEFFSEGLDRAKFGQHTVLMESIGSFSVCYLYKGQTYAAKQKLTKFIEAIQNNTSIWPILEKFFKTSQTLELKDSPFLEHLITNIFVS